MTIWVKHLLGFWALIWLCFGVAACPGSMIDNACSGKDCDGHGQCRVVDEQAVCDCDQGFVAQDGGCVVSSEDPCAGQSCSGHGSCVVLAGAASCDCDDGYAAQDLSCVAVEDPCAEQSCSGHGSCVVLAGAASCDCDDGYAAQGLSCVASTAGADALVWFVHISDLHFGDSADISDSLAVVLDEVLPAVQPALSIASGDITDEGTSFQWSRYRSVIDSAVVPSYPSYLEIPGNHDVKRDHAPNFVAQSQTGRAGGDLFGQSFVDTPVGRIRVVRTNTADSSSNIVAIAGRFSSEQADALMALTDMEPASVFPIVVGHHPIVGAERLRAGFDRMQALIQQSGARLYFCGHTHRRKLAWLDQTLMVQGDSLGKSDPGSFALVSLDETGPAAIFVPVSTGLSWPQVLITAPADPDLGGGNPFAQPLAAGTTLTLRAIAFSPNGVNGLRFQLGAVDVAASEIRAHVWEAQLTVPAGSGSLTLTATATDASAATAQHSFQLSYP